MQILQIRPVHLCAIDIMLKFMMTELICTLLVRNPCSSIVKSDTYIHHLYTVYSVLLEEYYAFVFYNILYKYFIIRFHTSFSLLQMSDAAKIMVLYKCMYIVNFCHEYHFSYIAIMLLLSIKLKIYRSHTVLYCLSTCIRFLEIMKQSILSRHFNITDN